MTTGTTDKRSTLRAAVQGVYDLQKLRIQIGNRIVANRKVLGGQAPGESEEEMPPESKMLLDELRLRYKRIADAMKDRDIRKAFELGEADEIISDYAEFSLIGTYVSLQTAEEKQFKDLEHVLKRFPIWTEFLEGVKGIGPALAAVIVSHLDPHKARHISSFWKYCGLDVGPDGRGRGKYAEHLVDVEYTTRDGEVKQKKGITFSPFLKTKLMGVAAASFIKVGRERSPYARIYYEYKNRMENHAKWGLHNDGKKDENGRFITSKAKRHAMAMRASVKQFLADLWSKWRELEGLPITRPYREAMLGYPAHGQDSAAA